MTTTLTAGSPMPTISVSLDEVASPAATATAQLVGGAGDSLALTAKLTEARDAVTIGGEFSLDDAGLWRAVIVVTDAAPYPDQSINDIWLIVEAVTGWHSIATAREDWPDAPADDRRLADLLAVARDQCEAFAPEIAAPDWPPAAWRLAQLTQARNLWNGSRVDAAGNAGVDGFALAPFPLDWQVKQLLRPRNPRPIAT